MTTLDLRVDGITEVQVITLQPGDVLACITDMPITNEQSAHIKEKLRAVLVDYLPEFVDGILVLDRMHFEILRAKP